MKHGPQRGTENQKEALGVSTEGSPTDRALPGMRPNRIGLASLACGSALAVIGEIETFVLALRRNPQADDHVDDPVEDERADARPDQRRSNTPLHCAMSWVMKS